MLEYESYNALHEEPSATNRTIRLEANLTETDLAAPVSPTVVAMILQSRKSG